MNKEAARDAKKLLQAVETGKLDGEKIPCDSAEYDGEHCHGQVYAEPWYDIFSDDPKGLIAQCEYHRDHEGTPEGYFYCGDCNQLFISNYTWEMYEAYVEGDVICLPCHAARIIKDDSRWTPLTPKSIESISFAQIRKAPHCIGVRMPAPAEIVFQANVELDSASAGRLTGFSSCESTPEGGVREIRKKLEELRAQGYTRAVLILDAAYQFSVSIGIYTDSAETAHAEKSA